MTGSSDQPQFPTEFQHEFVLGGQLGSKGYFGTNVLRGLTEGIHEFLQDPDQRWSQYRSLGPAILGCVPWLDDPELLDSIEAFPAPCVVINKLDRKTRPARVDARTRLAREGGGFPADIFASLTSLASRYDGPVPVLGPHSARPPEVRIQSIRTFGYRKTGSRPVPLLHAKMFLLGHLWWHDESDAPGVVDVTGFTAKRLWLGSTNGTKSSRLGLEFGAWFEDDDLLAAAERFLVQLMRSSEAIGPDEDLFNPEFVEFDYDDEAFAEAMGDWEDSDDPDEDS
jgi:hypothetical protein